MSGSPAMPSKSAVRKAGSTIRRFAAGEATVEQYEAAIEVVQQYRAQFGRPVVVVNNGLRRIAESCGVSAKVTQRIKREATIIEKLSDREKGLDLSRMQDVGGLRAVVITIADLRTLEAAICAKWGESIERTDDYVSTPRSSGYRAVHLRLRRDGLPIEIQLRTAVMHDWAEFVEHFSKQLQINFKQDTGDHLFQVLAREVAEVYRRREEGIPDDPSHAKRISSLSTEFDALLKRRHQL